jgi:hypothetical protein
MNTTEVQLLFRLLRQIARQAETIARLLELLTEANHARYVAGHAGGAGVAAATTASTEFPAPDGEGSLLRQEVQLDADRTEPWPSDPGTTDTGRDMGLSLVGSDWMSRIQRFNDSYFHSGLYRAGGSPADPGTGDCGGDPLPPGGDGAGDDSGRVGDGDADTQDDCRYRYHGGGVWDQCAGHTHCRICGDYEPDHTPNYELAAPVAVVTPASPARVCAECGQEKPLRAFSWAVGPRQAEPVGQRRTRCQACDREVRRQRARGARAAVAEDLAPEAAARPGPAARARQRLARDPGYQNGLRQRLERLAVGYGQCERCGQAGQIYADPAQAQHLCLACRQADERKEPRCLICNAVIPPQRRHNGKTCSEECAKEKNRQYAATRRAEKRAAAAGGV